MWNAAAAFGKSALETVQTVQNVLAEEFDEQQGEEEEGVYRQMLEELQFAQLKLSNDYQRELDEKKKLQEQLGIKEAGGDNEEDGAAPTASPEALKEQNRLLTDQIKAWEGKMRELIHVKTDISAQLMRANSEAEKLKAKNETMAEEVKENKGSADTIENLVAEYSKLSEEGESQKTEFTAKILNLNNENSELKIKMKSLEDNLVKLLESSSTTTRSEIDNVEMQYLESELAKARAEVLALQDEVSACKENAGGSEPDTKVESDTSAPAAAPAAPGVSSAAMEAALAAKNEEHKAAVAKLEKDKAEAFALLLEAKNLEATHAAAVEKLQAEHAQALADAVAAAKAEAGEDSSTAAAAAQKAAEKVAADAQAQQQAQQQALEASKVELASEVEKLKAEAQAQQQATAVGASEASEQAQAELEAVKGELEAAKADLEAAKADLQAHKEVAQAELEECKKAADAEKAAALEACRAEGGKEGDAAIQAAVDRCKEEQMAALAETTKEAEEVLKKCEADTTQQMQAKLEQAVAACKEAEEKEKEKALQEQAAKSSEEQQLALDRLKGECDAELKQELASLEGKLGETAAAERERLTAQASADLEQAVAAAKADLEAKVSEAQAALKEVEAVFEEKQRQALEKASEAAAADKAAALAELQGKCDAIVKSAEDDRDEYKATYQTEVKRRREIHNKLMDLMGNIRVICRIRPVLAVDNKTGEDEVVVKFPSEEQILVTRDDTSNRFEFDRVFALDSTQQQVFDAVQPMIVSAMDGYKVCIFAYGQTGSGKTFTMEGSEDNRGVTFRALGEVFEMADERKDDWTYELSMSMLEIYNENVRDLLAPPAKKGESPKALDVRQGPDGSVVPGLCETAVASMEQVCELMDQGNGNRAVGVHDMNAHSSRSHSIIVLKMPCTNKHSGQSFKGKLHLIDLAGSERVGKTGCSGDRLKEAQNINRSLSALGDVIAALGAKTKNGKAHVPYRNSKLTFFLQDSLGGNSKVLMFVNASPCLYNAPETQCSLTFAARCRNTELGSAKRSSGESVAKYKAHIEKLKGEIETLKKGK